MEIGLNAMESFSITLNTYHILSYFIYLYLCGREKD
ncbi:hypothetical protein OIU78_003578 [Salix suchowensis]|nr:hypothetical protein OIU78_003578 [Salix suchowensis]